MYDIEKNSTKKGKCLQHLPLSLVNHENSAT
ncbi:hypothetical protein M2459_001469 [Parabacteroides sp. PF5-5]|nr:hypothetical protein [Parabacteroides sp. PH5-39]MDH6315653.1 hypothetical protein [Parabacteroides sp. PF5-13]MDH6319314.1 hypothetical protein [Parabacteroides sp. PH5-13]MDH6323045.1 hypothetical protein [Parabacteroides sp. PH5-8]MDH6326846.1 hypothetical protein [Parabacteroides sp. PH5-41]MDH6334725.1 hypothetical protein [Parabacteroides sp. PF5-5]MDH6345789.1 hypothetical protein [Parabacteroides sp. PH5-46]MDH6360745.1 hypothetical protein [Parabacteroides sp. PH5-16]MDH6376333.